MENENAFADLGSINDFAERQGIDPRDPETLVKFTAELVQRQEAVAKSVGIGVSELHTLDHPQQSTGEI